MNITVFASGEGTTLQAIIDACADGRLPAQVVLVIANNRDAGALRRARATGIAALHLSRQTHPEPGRLERAIVDALNAAATDIVFLAGYLRKIESGVLNAYRGRIFNTHPALLPRHGGPGLYGHHVHEAVLAAGDTESGATVHLLTEQYDAGAIVAQCRVPVLADDTPASLAARVQHGERELVVDVLKQFAQGRLALPFIADRGAEN